jgi:hypothetical protein
MDKKTKELLSTDSHGLARIIIVPMARKEVFVFFFALFANFVDRSFDSFFALFANFVDQSFDSFFALFANFVDQSFDLFFLFFASDVFDFSPKQ